MTKTYWELNKFDVETRIEDEGRPDPRKLLIARDVTEDGVVLQTTGRESDGVPHAASADHGQFRLQIRDAGRHHRVFQRHQL